MMSQRRIDISENVGYRDLGQQITSPMISLIYTSMALLTDCRLRNARRLSFLKRT